MFAGHMRPIRMALPASRAHAAASMATQHATGDADARGLLRRARPRTVTAPAGVHAQIPGFAAPRIVLLPSLQVGFALAAPAQHGLREADLVTALRAPAGTNHATTCLDDQHPTAAAVRARLLGGRVLGAGGAPAAQVAADDAHRSAALGTVTLAFTHVLQ